MRNFVMLILMGLLLASCGPSGIKIGSTTDPCVITEITQCSEEGMSWYKTTNGILGMQTGLFVVGDTLDFTNLGASRRLLASFYSKVPTNKIKSQTTGADTTLTINVGSVRITPGLMIGFNKDTLEVGYDKKLILGR